LIELVEKDYHQKWLLLSLFDYWEQIWAKGKPNFLLAQIDMKNYIVTTYLEK